jgi:gliding motility-associated lipoprotein GldH
MYKKSSVILSAIACLLFVSCDKSRVFDEYKSVGKSWDKDSIVEFNLPKLDETKYYNLYVNIRNNNNYQFSNLFLIVSLEQPNRKVTVDTLEYVMTNPDGSLLGEGFSDTKENKLVYKSNFKFNQKGDYKVLITHANRKTGNIDGVKELEGIIDVGFRIETKE